MIDTIHILSIPLVHENLSITRISRKIEIIRTSTAMFEMVKAVDASRLACYIDNYRIVGKR